MLRYRKRHWRTIIGSWNCPLCAPGLAVDVKLKKESLGFGVLQCCRVVVLDQETDGGPVPVLEKITLFELCLFPALAA